MMIWITLTFCLLFSFLFAGIEAGLLSVNRVRLRHRAKTGDRSAKILARLLEKPQRILITVLLIANFSNICAIAIVARELVRAYGTTGYLVGLILLLPLYLVALEVLPKSLFRRFPFRALTSVAMFLAPLNKLFLPIQLLTEWITRLVSKHETANGNLFLGREEFKYLTIEGERSGAITPAERGMIHGIVDFRSVTAKDVMIPMSAVKSAPGTLQIKDLLERFRKTKIGRWPITNDSGEITGIVDVFDLLVDGRQRGNAETFQRRIVKVAPGDSAYSVLRKLRVARATMAAVVEAGARPVGVVTWEALTSRLLGAKKTP